MKYALIIILITMNIKTSAQMTNDQINIEKWVKAVINLDTREISNQAMDQLRSDLAAKKITFSEYVRLSELEAQNLKTFFGTAIFIKYNDREYLITAKHVLEDTSQPEDGYNNRIFKRIFLVDNIKDKHDNSKGNNLRQETMLMNLGSGASSTRLYIYSSDLDLGIVCIGSDMLTKKFTQTLYNRGYFPIEYSDIDINQVKEGQGITAIGFTQDFFVREIKGLPQALKNWQSDLVTTPILSYGSVDTKITEAFFSGNIFVYHGNSGGPVISNNKLVGIVVGGDGELYEVGGFYFIRRYTKIINSKRIVELLNDLEARILQNEKTLK